MNTIVYSLSILIHIYFLSSTLIGQNQISKIDYRFISHLSSEKSQSGIGKRMFDAAEQIESDKLTLWFNKTTSYFERPTSSNLDIRLIYINTNIHPFSVDLIGKRSIVIETTGGVKNIIYPMNYITWKIDKTLKKEIAGYTCYKGSYLKGKKEITAWFTPEIPVPFGPSNYTGLPGLILELHVPLFYTLYAQKVTLNDPSIKSIPNYEKGQEITIEEYTKSLSRTKG